MLFGLALVSLASALSVSATPVVDVAKRSIPDSLSFPSDCVVCSILI